MGGIRCEPSLRHTQSYGPSRHNVTSLHWWDKHNTSLTFGFSHWTQPAVEFKYVLVKPEHQPPTSSLCGIFALPLLPPLQLWYWLLTLIQSFFPQDLFWPQRKRGAQHATKVISSKTPKDIAILINNGSVRLVCPGLYYWFGHFLFYFVIYILMCFVLLSTSCLCLFSHPFSVYTCVPLVTHSCVFKPMFYSLLFCLCVLVWSSVLLFISFFWYVLSFCIFLNFFLWTFLCLSSFHFSECLPFEGPFLHKL